MRPTHPIEIFRSNEFMRWLDKLRDDRARIAVEARLRRLLQGSFGDSRSVGSGVIELRVDIGPGYRVYFVRLGDAIVVLLCGGDKSTQQADIASAKRMAETAEEIANDPRN